MVAASEEWSFETPGPVAVPPGELTPLHLEPNSSAHRGRSPVGSSEKGGVAFHQIGWYEVLLTVEWDPEDRSGTRFSHTRIPGEQPLHSEAIAADVLSRISEGKQLLRGNGVFGPDDDAEIVLEVWHDAPRGVTVRRGAVLVLQGFVAPLTGAPIFTVITTRTPAALRAKVLSAAVGLMFFTGPLGQVAGGPLINAVGARMVLVIAGAGCLVGSAPFAIYVALNRSRGEPGSATRRGGRWPGGFRSGSPGEQEAAFP